MQMELQQGKSLFCLTEVCAAEIYTHNDDKWSSAVRKWAVKNNKSSQVVEREGKRGWG